MPTPVSTTQKRARSPFGVPSHTCDIQILLAKGLSDLAATQKS